MTLEPTANLTDRIRRLHRCSPTLTTPQIAAQLGCRPEYVRAVKQRLGLKIPTARKCHKRDA